MTENISQTLTTTTTNTKVATILNSGYYLLNKHYLPSLGQEEALLTTAEDEINFSTDVRIFRVDRLVVENKQSILESLSATYTSLGSAGFSVFLILDNDGTGTTVYLGTSGLPQQSVGHTAGELLQETFNGHFLGSQLKTLNGQDVQNILQKFDFSENTESFSSITAVTSIPSLSIEEREHFVQGLEHFIDATEGKVYQALLLAKPIHPRQLDLIQQAYEDVASQFSPLLKTTWSYGENESTNVSESINYSIGKSLGHSLGRTETQGNSTTTGTTQTRSHTIGGGVSTSVSAGVSVAPLGIGGSAQMSTTYSMHYSTSFANSIQNSLTTSLSVGKTTTNTETNSQNLSIGKTSGMTSGSSIQITRDYLNKSVAQLLKKIDYNLDRIEVARCYGGWYSAAYFFGKTPSSSQSLASIFLGLMRGDNSNNENHALTTWSYKENAKNYNKVVSWLKNLEHPRIKAVALDNIYIDYLTPATLISGKELAIQLGLPRKSITTLSVLEGKSFGRKIQKIKVVNQNASSTLPQSNRDSLTLGKIFHLWVEKTQDVDLDIPSLSGHTFITGSTGSGKSNTVYHILNQLSTRHQIPFLVIEPAKGEYKHVFGHRQDVTVLGTNPSQAELLKINPFRFPTDGVHILEHIDRLVEIFNVCWPMYAAMPAILKEAILDAYAQCGWNLTTSTNSIDNQIFPTFRDLLDSLESVIEKSAFSQEVKGNYTGALITRVRSLTNGLNSLIFSSNEIDSDKLFNSNVIVDLSRIGSQETKSLIMGILVMRLGEYRMSYSGMNEPLKHVTVLEEAHNILRRTSTEQSSEGANVAGKSVELLSNAIAEMRTYGEGFIIADQSPNAIDISAIRNTNTKIIMRLPDEMDRQLVGKAAGATEEQIPEIAKLPQGVAVVYQNDWLEPVLCKVSRFDTPTKQFEHEITQHPLDEKLFNLHLMRLILASELAKEDSFEKIDYAILSEQIAYIPLRSLDVYFINQLIETVVKDKIQLPSVRHINHKFDVAKLLNINIKEICENRHHKSAPPNAIILSLIKNKLPSNASHNLIKLATEQCLKTYKTFSV